MINEASLRAVNASLSKEGFCQPLYDTYGFAQIPATVSRLLTGQAGGLPLDCTGGGQYESVVLFLIDAFGWEFFQKYSSRYPFLARFLEKGIVSKITSQFPSTTTAHMTTLHTGLEVGQTGIYEWFQYEPLVDQIVAPLLYSFAGDHEGGSLTKTDLSPSAFYPWESVYTKLLKKGISSTLYHHAGIAISPYSSVAFKGAENQPYVDTRLGARLLREKIEEGGFFYFYVGDIDGACHKHGMHSSHVEKAADVCFEALEEFFWSQMSSLKKKTAVLLTADHGMVDINPEGTFYINLELPELLPLIRKNKEGLYLAPAGSCRDFFLHIEEGKKDEALKILKKALSDRAEVVDTERLVREGYFGKETPSLAFLKRVGDIVILPRGDHSVWWYEKHRFDQKFYAMHGGLSSREMESIFLFQEVGG